jgi:hypothetical protein
MRAQIWAVVAGLGLLAGTGTVAAHHAFSAEFDADKPIELTGTVTKVDFINPHGWIHMDVKKPDGTVEKWSIEMGTVGTLLRRGLTKDVIPPGLQIKIAGYLARDGSKKANGRTITLADGKSLDLGSSIGAAAPGAR